LGFPVEGVVCAGPVPGASWWFPGPGPAGAGLFQATPDRAGQDRCLFLGREPGKPGSGSVGIPEFRDGGVGGAVLDSATVGDMTQVTAPSGEVVEVPEGGRLEFGRGADVDLVIASDRGLSRRAGVVVGVPGGAWVANLSGTHALYVETDGYQVRLPPLEGRSEPIGGWFTRAGTLLVGSRAMLDEGQAVRVEVSQGAWSVPGQRNGSDEEATLRPLYLDPKTKLFLVALLWCRPWLLDPGRSTPLPRVPEIARGALSVTEAHHELERFDKDPAFRERIAARVGEHLRVLRRKITSRGLARPGTRLSDEVVVGALIDHAVITAGDLAKLDDPSWCSRQEDLWWDRS